MLRRAGDNDARDSGQWGVALRWLGDEAEYGLYALNYHSRTPNLSYINADAASIAAIATTARGLPPAFRTPFVSLGLLGLAALMMRRRRA